MEINIIKEENNRRMKWKKGGGIKDEIEVKKKGE